MPAGGDFHLKQEAEIQITRKWIPLQALDDNTRWVAGHVKHCHIEGCQVILMEIDLL